MTGSDGRGLADGVCVLVVQACFGGGVLLSLLGVYLLSTQPPGAADDESASDAEDDDAGEPQSTARLLTIFLELGCVAHDVWAALLQHTPRWRRLRARRSRRLRITTRGLTSVTARSLRRRKRLSCW